MNYRILDDGSGSGMLSSDLFSFLFFLFFFSST